MKYVVAVSGGVDSVVMLDILAKEGQHELIVAHVDHGIRPDSVQDKQLVKQLALHYGCIYESTSLDLGANASEEQARNSRHGWLQQQREQYDADAIATAHHKDDVLETMVINIARGTGWRGICSLRATDNYVRPLLTWEKTHIISYAIDHGLFWREDTTNDDLRYLRNYIRHGVLSRLSREQKQQLYDLYTRQITLLNGIDEEIKRFYTGAKNRYFLTMVSEEVAYELMRSWLPEPLERRRLRALLLFVKTAQAGSRWSLDATRYIGIVNEQLVVTEAEN